MQRSRDCGRIEVDGTGAGKCSVGALEPARTTSDSAREADVADSRRRTGRVVSRALQEHEEQIAVDALKVAVPENVFAAKFTQCGYVAVNRPRCEPVPVNGTASEVLGSPGVTSKMPAYLKVIGKVAAAAAVAVNSATQKRRRERDQSREGRHGLPSNDD
jgi:hypothetical protein